MIFMTVESRRGLGGAEGDDLAHKVLGKLSMVDMLVAQH